MLSCELKINSIIMVHICIYMYNSFKPIFKQRKEKNNMEWNQDAKDLLEELVSPIPIFVRPMAKKKIESVILKSAAGESITKEDVVKGYIVASPGDMQERAVKLLKIKGIDLTPYQSLLEQVK